MPDDIAVIDGKPAFAYQHESPWHKLGQPMKTMDVNAALKAAKLDWRVELKDLLYDDGHGHMVKSKFRRTVIRDVDQKELATVGNDYHPLQNADAFGVLQPACEKLGVTIETAGALGAGDRVWMLAKMPETVEIVPGDVVEQFFLVLTGHNGWSSYTARGTDVRVVCANTLSMATAGSRALIALKHTASLKDQFTQVSDVISKLLLAARDRSQSFKKLADRRLTADELHGYINDVLDITDQPPLNPLIDRRRKTILALVERGPGANFAPNTAWAAFNGVAAYVDHVRPAEAKSALSVKQTNESALFGANMRLKQRALMLAKRLVA